MNFYFFMMEKQDYYWEIQLSSEGHRRRVYSSEFKYLDIIAIGMEGFLKLIELNEFYPNLRCGYIYHYSLWDFPDHTGRSIAETFTYIPLVEDFTLLYGGEYYKVNQMDNLAVFKMLELTSSKTLFIGAMHDPIMVKLLGYYGFNRKQLILRRPVYFENSSQRAFINRYLKFSDLPPNVRVIDTNKINRYLKRLDGIVVMPYLFQEVEAQWGAQIIQRLRLEFVDNMHSPRLRLESTWC